MKLKPFLWPAGLVLLWGMVLLAVPGPAAGADQAPALTVEVSRIPSEFREGGLTRADLQGRLESLAREAGLKVLGTDTQEPGQEKGQKDKELVLSVEGSCQPTRLCSITLRLALNQGSRTLRSEEITQPIGRNNVQEVRRLVRDLFGRLMAKGQVG